MYPIISEKQIADDSYDNIWSGDLWDNWQIVDDLMDLNFEFSPTQLVRTDSSGVEKFILPGLIDFVGFIGAYGEESVCVPKYLVEQMRLQYFLVCYLHIVSQ